MYRPKRFSAAELLKSGVELFYTSGSGYWFKCCECSKVWTAAVIKGGQFPRGYWKCPACCEFTNSRRS